MSDKQSGRSETDGLSPERDEESAREKNETTRSYYYDDATGYEVYDDEDETQTDEPIDRAEDES